MAIVVGVVLGTDASGPVGTVVGGAAVLGLGGIFGGSFSLVGTSAGLLLAYTLALAMVAPPPGVVMPVLVGSGLTLLLVTGERATRGRGARVDHRVLAAWLRDVTGTAVLAGVSGVGLGAAGATVVLDLPASVYPLVAAVAALAVVVGTGRAVASARSSRVDHAEDA